MAPSLRAQAPTSGPTEPPPAPPGGLAEPDTSAPATDDPSTPQPSADATPAPAAPVDQPPETGAANENQTEVEQEPQEPPRRLRVRVIPGAAPGAAMIDRGRSDKLEIGDTVELDPRTGAILRGSIVRVDSRTSLVELEVRTSPPAGTVGQVQVPASRFRRRRPRQTTPEPDQEQAPIVTPPRDPDNEPSIGEQPKPRSRRWRNRDRGYKAGQPLLANAVRPERRRTTVEGRVYSLGEFTRHFESDFDQSFGRLGVGLDIDNPLGYGGRVESLIETNYRTEFDEEEGANLFVRRLSYTYGGDRFQRHRLQAGRFLQYGFPEFSTIDGVQYSRRITGNSEFGGSLGFLPVPDDDFNTYDDFQASVWFLYKADQYERTVLGAGFQKVLHEFDSDRNLFVLKGRSDFQNGWHADGRLHIDVKGDEDRIRDEAILFSQAVGQVTRRFEDGHVFRIGYRRLARPEIDRYEFIRPNFMVDPAVIAAANNELANDVYDRLFVEGHAQVSKRTRIHGHVAGFVDEDTAGASLELGMDVRDVIGTDSNLDVIAFGNSSEFVSVIGARAIWNKRVDGGMYNVFYEIANHRETDFPEAITDVVQHRLRFSRNFFTASGFDADAYGEVQVIGTDISYTLGLFFQRRF